MGSHLKRPYPRLGHASIGITSDVYVHLQPDSELESMKKLEERFLQQVLFARCVR
jgi:integrase